MLLEAPSGKAQVRVRVPRLYPASSYPGYVTTCGTKSGYNSGCRCPACTAANSDAKRRQRSARSASSSRPSTSVPRAGRSMADAPPPWAPAQAPKPRTTFAAVRERRQAAAAPQTGAGHQDAAAGVVPPRVTRRPATGRRTVGTVLRAEAVRHGAVRVKPSGAGGGVLANRARGPVTATGHVPSWPAGWRG